MAPIYEQFHPVKQSFVFLLYGTEMQVRLDNTFKNRLPNLKLESIAKEQLSEDKYNNVIHDCLELRIHTLYFKHNNTFNPKKIVSLHRSNQLSKAEQNSELFTLD